MRTSAALALLMTVAIPTSAPPGANQVRQAFESAGATPQEVDGFSARFLEKVRELDAATARGRF
jgi:hypothetical protein